MEKIKLNVEGMSCGHCVNAVTTALMDLEGVSNVNVDLSTKTVEFDHATESISLEDIKKVIVDEGYEVV